MYPNYKLLCLSNCNFVSLKKCTNLIFFNDIGKLSNPYKAVVWGDEQETITTVQGGCSRLHQPGLDMPSACFYTQMCMHTHVAYQWQLWISPPTCLHYHSRVSEQQCVRHLHLTLHMFLSCMYTTCTTLGLTLQFTANECGQDSANTVYNKS